MSRVQFRKSQYRFEANLLAGGRRALEPALPCSPNPVSAMHCWHQRVRVERAQPDYTYGDVIVDTKRSHEIYKEWLEKERPAPARWPAPPALVLAAGEAR